MADYKEIGAQLRQKRVACDKKIEDISEEIKVSVEYLSAIEDGRLNDLPSDVYYKLFVRAYGQEVGLDVEKLLEEPEFSFPIRVNNNKKESRQSRPKQNKESKSSDVSLLKVGTIIGAVVIIGFIVILFLSLGNNGAEPELADIETTDADYNDLPDDPDLNQTDSSQIEELVAATEPKQNYPANVPMELQVSVNQTSWVLVIADGDTVLNRNLEPGSIRTLKAEYRFAVSMGNPFGVELFINDSLLKPLSETGRPVKNLEINQLNKSEYYFHPEEKADEEL